MYYPWWGDSRLGMEEKLIFSYHKLQYIPQGERTVPGIAGDLGNPGILPPHPSGRSFPSPNSLCIVWFCFLPLPSLPDHLHQTHYKHQLVNHITVQRGCGPKS